MPYWIIILMTVGTAFAVLRGLAKSDLRTGVTALLVGAIVIGIGLLSVYRMRMANVHQAAQQESTREALDIQQGAQLSHAAEVRRIAEIHQRQIESVSAARTIPDSALSEAAPRAPEPDDNAVPLAARTAFRTPPAAAQTPAASPQAKEETPPAWAVHGAGRQMDGHYYAVVTAVGRTTEECWIHLYNHELPSVIHNYAMHEIAAPWWYPRVDRRMVDSLVIDQYIGPWERGGPNIDGSPRMHQLFVRLRFNPEVREMLLAQRAEQLVSSRLTYTIWGGVLSFVAIGIVFSYLKLDALYDGIYTYRLRIAAGALLVCVAVGCMMLFGYFMHVEAFGGIFSAA